jgi:type IV pilus assembly protein PilB
VTAADEFVAELVQRGGVVRVAVLEAARVTQHDSADEFGEMPTLAEILVSVGAIEADVLCAIQAREMALPVRPLAGLRIPGEVLAAMSREQALRYQMMPTAIIQGTLQIAMDDPLKLDLVDELSHVLGRPIEVGLAPLGLIRKAIAQAYGGDESDVLSTMSDVATTSVETGGEDGDDALIIKQVYSIISNAVLQRASDIHLEPLERRFRVRYRIDGRLWEVESPPKRMQLAIISRLKILADLSIAEKRLPQDGRIQLKIEGRAYDFRVASIPTAHGESIVLRILDQAGLKTGLAELGLSSEDEQRLRRLVTLADGMVLVTGPTGSGKTTTLYSCLQHINRPDRKIITVEDPVEYLLCGVNQVPVRTEVGLSFAAALRAMLRQAPNVVMVGEIRDRETADIAINASLTGHLVFSTLHTNDAPGAVTRLTDLGVKSFLVSSSLRAVVAQRLVRRVCSHCRQSREMRPDERAHFRGAGILDRDVQLTQGTGCPECVQTGYRGRVAIFEFFLITPEIARMIHAGSSLSTLRDCARRLGMRSLREDGLRKAACGITTLAEVFAATTSEP